jgi:rubrerythrin
MKNDKEGFNRTGMATSVLSNPEMLDNSEIESYTPEDPDALLEVREFYVESSSTIGTVPPPATIKSLEEAAKGLIKGQDSLVFMDKLGARLAFERTGTRLYEAFLQKLEILGPINGIPEIATVRQFFQEELSHMELVRQALQELGADPTAVTPEADIDAVASKGLLQVVSDPRTTVDQALHAIHIAELADNDAWEMLIELAEALGKDEMARNFEQALTEEERHLEQVRAWMSDLALNQIESQKTQKPQNKTSRKKATKKK